MRPLRELLLIGGALAVTACSPPAQDKAQPAQPAPQAAANTTPPTPTLAPSDTSGLVPVVNAAAPAEAPAGPLQAAPASPLAQAINQASWPATGAEANRDALLRAEVLLARARFSPGVIDGQDGGNLKGALSAFETAHNLPVDGKLSEAVWSALAADAAPAVVAHTITPADVAGPFQPSIPAKFEDQAKLDHLGYTSPLEALAEKFHMDEKLLQALNAGVDFSQAGTTILVAGVGPDALPSRVTTIEVDKTHRQVRAMDASGAVLAVYPATIGSTERPAPSGSFTVKGVAKNPTYTYDPSRLTFGDKSMGKLTIKPGPNNPVGAVWIDLSIPTFGIHGTPDPRLVGKTASHGCVRLTNWDAVQLASAVKPGTKVNFVGVEPAGPKSPA
ncbi:MAG: murein L,D-transpeptidase [Phenylobacterium sp.]|nr:MAG: murein L,D-transpeptidase [Phenylobacterium sp.]